ncbi:MAG: Gfo/Idh/MocA family oxidoreductase [Verrucomicrobiales bacterium]|nr:Gfo/Idh/MocA family oxidoreductase [Verrucomicrobiales bacterium]
MQNLTSSSRRKFVKTAGLTAAALNFQVVPSRVFGANDKLTLAGIGTAGKGASDISGSAGAGFQIEALVDIVNAEKYPNVSGRSKATSATRRAHPEARFYEDWRDMLEAEGDKIDAVTVSTPDHVHAHASIAAMKKGMHVYCQKPLTHGIWEARMMAKVADETGVVTQMGNQAHAQDHMRRCVELIRAGVIGDVKEIHCWTNRPIWPQAIPKWPGKEDVPKHINWDLWLGPSQEADYSSKIAPFNWRGYWDYGTGALGDMACHIMDMAYWAADLGAPTSVEAISADGKGAQSDVSPPTWATITYQFPERDGKPPVKFMWYDGYKDAIFDPEMWKLVSSKNGLPIGRIRGQENGERNLPPADVLEGQGWTEGKDGYGTVVIGSEGKMWFNRGHANWFIKPGNVFDGFDEPEQTIPRARGQNPHNEFYDAIKADDPKLALSGVWHSGSFTEMVLLGNLAVRLNKKVEWDAENLKSPNSPEADKLIKRDYRAGWELKV